MRDQTTQNPIRHEAIGPDVRGSEDAILIAILHFKAQGAHIVRFGSSFEDRQGNLLCFRLICDYIGRREVWTYSACWQRRAGRFECEKFTWTKQIEAKTQK